MNQTPARSVNPIPARVEIAGHLGELVQGCFGPGGPVALVTLPCPVLATRVGFTPARGALHASDPVSAKAVAAARLTLAAIGRPGWGGALTLARASEPGSGAGSSTAETLGAVRAVARAFGARLSPEREAVLCLEAEAAIDPLMHDRPMVFASREGRVLAPLSALPPMRVTGGFAGPPRTTDSAARDFPDQTLLFRRLAEAAEAGDLPALAEVATCSARDAQARHPNPAWEPMQALARRIGALGIAVSHTGPAIALILPPGAKPPGLSQALAGCGLRGIVDYRLP